MADTPALTYKGKPATAQRLVELYTNAQQRMGPRDDRIRKCQGLRRMTERVTLDPSFLHEHPEIDADRLVSLLPERESYERDLITKAGSVEPRISRSPLDVTDTALDLAEDYESYMRDVAEDDENGIPFQTFIEKGTEDGEYGCVSIPSHLDAEGLPDYYDRLTERALAAIPKGERAEYSPDEDDRRTRYVRRNPDGSRRVKPRYDPGPHPTVAESAETDVEARRADYDTRKKAYDRKNEQGRQKHADDVRRYMLQHAATNHRVIPALDCYPLLGRGTGKQRWSVEGIVERALLEREELVSRKFGWSMVGDRLLLPRGSSWTGAGQNGSFYLYTAYLTMQDEDGCDRPVILYTVGGAGTWWDGAPAVQGEDQRVAIIDLYDELSLRGRYWHYEFGSHTADDDPAWYGRPALWPFRNRILNVEELETAAHATVVMEAYTGSYYKPDARILEADPEAVVEQETHTLRRPTKPRPGEIQPWAGDVVPFQQNKVGDDAWRLQANYQAGLQAAMAIDASPDTNASGHALLVQSSQGQVAKRHIREAAIRMFKFCLEADASIRLGAYKTYGVKWPILSTTEQPIGHEVRKRTTYKELDPDWFGEDENVSLSVTFGEEFNLARAQLEMDAADRGYRALKHVAAAFGETDEMTLRVEIERDRQWKDPVNQALLQDLVDGLRGLKHQRAAAVLKAQQRLTQQGLPGAENGVPTAALARQGMQALPPGGPPPPNGQGGGGPTMASSMMGGINAAEMSGARMQLAAQQAAGQSPMQGA
jgi:hypothetical protein